MFSNRRHRHDTALSIEANLEKKKQSRMPLLLAFGLLALVKIVTGDWLQKFMRVAREGKYAWRLRIEKMREEPGISIDELGTSWFGKWAKDFGLRLLVGLTLYTVAEIESGWAAEIMISIIIFAGGILWRRYSKDLSVLRAYLLRRIPVVFQLLRHYNCAAFDRIPRTMPTIGSPRVDWLKVTVVMIVLAFFVMVGNFARMAFDHDEVSAATPEPTVVVVEKKVYVEVPADPTASQPAEPTVTKADDVEKDYGSAHTGIGVYRGNGGTNQCEEESYSSNPARNGLNWTVGSADQWTVVLPWTNKRGHNQDERRMLLAPGEVADIQMGGTQIFFPAECGEQAKVRFETATHYVNKQGQRIEREIVTLADLRKMGLVN